MRMLIAVALQCASVAFGQNAEATEQEIAEAYRSKSGEHATIIPGIRWETWAALALGCRPR